MSDALLHLQNLSMAKVFELRAKMESVNRIHGSEEKGVLTHTFTPGLYARTLFMPKGSLFISKIHKTEHPYVISQGRASVWTEDGVVELKAPHIGVTKPGTCRVLYIHEDCTWTTFHPTPHTDVDAIEADIIQPFPEPAQIEAEKS